MINLMEVPKGNFRQISWLQWQLTVAVSCVPMLKAEMEKVWISSMGLKGWVYYKLEAWIASAGDSVDNDFCLQYVFSVNTGGGYCSS